MLIFLYLDTQYNISVNTVMHEFGGVSVSKNVLIDASNFYNYFMTYFHMIFDSFMTFLLNKL